MREETNLNHKITNTSTMLNQILAQQKELTELYNSAANEACDQNVHSDLLTLLEDEHRLQSDIYRLMQRRGLNMPQHAPPEEITKARGQYSQQLK